MVSNVGWHCNNPKDCEVFTFQHITQYLFQFVLVCVCVRVRALYITFDDGKTEIIKHRFL